MGWRSLLTATIFVSQKIRPTCSPPLNVYYRNREVNTFKGGFGEAFFGALAGYKAKVGCPTALQVSKYNMVNYQTS